MKEAVASGIALSEDVIDALFEKFIAGMPRFLQKNSPVTPFCPCVDKALPVVKVLRNLIFIGVLRTGRGKAYPVFGE